MSNQVTAKKGLSVKDLVTTGIFTALLFVFTMIGGVFFATNPILTFYMPAGSALLCGPIYLLMVAKVQKRWSLTITGVLIGIVWFVTGMHWAFALGYMIMGIVADFAAVQDSTKAKKSISSPIFCSHLAGLARISYSLQTQRAGRRPCWEMERSRATLIPCRQQQILVF